jgi:hypothetical protein
VVVLLNFFFILISLLSFNSNAKEILLNNSNSYLSQNNQQISQQKKQFNSEFLNSSNAFKKTIESFYSYDDIKPNFKPYKFGKFNKNDSDETDQQEKEEKPSPSELSSIDIKKIKKATPYIECYGDDEYFIASAGYYIDNTTIIVPSIATNSKCNDILVIAYGGMADDPKDDRFYRAQVITETNEWNFSVIETPEIKESIELLYPSEKEVKKNERVYVSTHNEEQYWYVDEATVQNTFKSKWSYDEQQFNNNLIQFNSDQNPIILGSLYFNENLELVGLGALDEKTNDHVAINVTDLMSYFSYIMSLEEEEEVPPASNESEEYLECQDSNDSGYLDVCYIDSNENSVIDSILVDENEDGIDDVLYVDANENDIYEVKVILPEGYFDYDYTLYILDDDEDETYDYIGHDYDNDQQIDEYEEIS